MSRWRVPGVHNAMCSHLLVTTESPGVDTGQCDPDTETERGITADNVFMLRQSGPRCGLSCYGGP